jgi:hypothetical protein
VALYRKVSKPYVSKAVELLVNRGCLETCHDKDDRRLKHLHVTDRAKEAADILHQAQFSFYDKVTEGLSNAELSAMLSAIENAPEILLNSLYFNPPGIIIDERLVSGFGKRQEMAAADFELDDAATRVFAFDL